MKSKFYATLFLLAVSISMAAFSQPVIPDSTFNGTGRKIFSVGGGALDFGDNVAVQADGKILMTGATFIGSIVKLGIARLNSDGTYDPTFGTAGISLVDCGTLTYQGGFDPEIIVRSDGKIIVSGSTQNAVGGDDMLVCRLLPNGQLDNTFGTGGIASVDMTGANMLPDGVHAIAADAAGNIYGCGSTRLGGTPFTNDLAVFKLTSAGALDPGFSGDGRLLLDLSGNWDFGFGIAVQADNKIVVSGYSGLPADFFAIRLTPDGSLDPTYGTAGKTTVDIFGLAVADEVFGMTMTADEKIYIVGDGYNSALSEFQTAVVRLTAAGVPDPTFNSDGIATFDILPGQNEFFKDLFIQSNGQCLVGGSVGTNSQDFAVFKMNADGTLVNDFNNTGSYIVDVSGLFKDDLGYGLAMQSDGKIILSGNTSFSNAVNEKYSIMRLAPNGVLVGFTASASLVCEGSDVQFTNTSVGQDLSYQWTFEGGTPATSTLINPIVTYSTAGFYDVKLRINNIDYADSLIITDMIEVIATPGAPSAPAGPLALCNLQTAQYSIAPVLYATTYNWQLTPSSAGTLAGNGTLATFTASPSFTGAFSINANAVNQCGTSIWSEALNGTINYLPVIYILQGDGGYCEGTSGATLTLSGSETGIDYQLLLAGLPAGASKPGTGSSLAWEDISTFGFYTVEAQTPNCTIGMAGQIYVSTVAAPAQPTAPTGPAAVCNNQAATYTVTGTSAEDVLIWTLEPASAGTLVPSGTSVTISWAGGYSGNAELSVQAQNNCGTSTSSVPYTITVNANPVPVISGLQTVCEAWSSTYLTSANTGSTYQWTVSGGIITEGVGTASVTVLWGNAGNGTLVVTETSNALCIGTSTEFVVLIDPCTSVGENQESAQMIVFPNPAHDKFTIHFGNALIGNHTLKLADALGRVLLEKYISSGLSEINNLEVSSLPNGYYTLFLIKDNSVIMQTKVLKN